jgi:hypothetical protein
MVGVSAGGAIAQIAALDLDPTEGRHPASESFNPTVSVTTGATLAKGIDAGLVSETSPVSPLLLHQHEDDYVTAKEQPRPRRPVPYGRTMVCSATA